MIAQQSPATNSQSNAWRTHAIALYEARIVKHGWRRAASNPGEDAYVVLSRENNEYAVRYIEATGEARCNCRAGVHRVACAHAGLVLQLKQRERRMLGVNDWLHEQAMAAWAFQGR